MAAFTAIDDAGAHYSTHLYTGNSSTNAITGVGFQPDFTWLKYRNGVSTQTVQSSVIGDNYLSPNGTDGETAAPNWDSFDSDGFTVSGVNSNYNASGYAYCSWNWKAGTTSGITTDGSTTITPSSYTFNQTAGFSTINYTGNSINDGQTVPHRLGAIPSLIMIKQLDSASQWSIYHKNLGNSKAMVLNTTAGSETDAGTGSYNYWYRTDPDSVNFTIGSSHYTNPSEALVAWCFTTIQGFSKFGMYESNSNADGTFVYCGFRPAYILAKSSDGTSDWYMFDNKRLGFNDDNNSLLPNTTAAEGTTDRVNILSNGFKFINSGAPNNGNTSIFMAFAESPFVNSSGVPTNAR